MFNILKNCSDLRKSMHLSDLKSTMDLTIEQALQRAVEAHKAGKLQDAEALYRAILQTQPKHPDANHNLGLMAVSLNKTEAAIPLFKIALEANPIQGQFWLSYVDALIKQKQFEEAKNLLELGKKRGLAGKRVDVLEEKLTAIILAQKSEPSRSPPQIELDTLLEYYKKGRYDLAQSLARTQTEQYPNHPFGWKILGALFQETGKLQDAVIANQKVLEISLNDAEAHSNLGITLKELGRLEDAETSYKKAIAIKPNFAEAHYNLGNTLKDLGRLEDAKTCYKNAIAIKADYADAHSNLGNTLNELGRLEDAETSYKKAIAIKPNFAEVHYNLGNTLKELGRLEDAETSYKKAIAIKADYADAHSNLGNTLKELGRLEDAETSYKKAIAIKPDLAEAHSNLGITLKELGRLEDAETSCKKAIAIKPNFAEAHYNLGNTLKDLGRLEDAEASYKKAIANKPDYAEKLSHQIASISGLNPARATDAYVSGLFDVYAKKFESSLVGELKYKIPKIIADLLRPFVSSINPTFDILDLGCGTGLSGEALINLAKTLVGIDLSKEMLKIAKTKNIYHRLIQDEIHHALSHERRASFDIVVSSDVFVYIGDIKPIFDQVHDVLKLGGFFAYSTEALYLADNGKEEDSPDYKLNSNGRYSHSLKYLLGLIDAGQFILHNLEEVQIRLEKGQPVMGYVVIMQKQT